MAATPGRARFGSPLGARHVIDFGEPPNAPFAVFYGPTTSENEDNARKVLNLWNAAIGFEALPDVGPLTLRQWALDQVEVANEARAEARAIRSLTAPRLVEVLALPRVAELLNAGAVGHAALAIVEALREEGS